MEHFKLSVENLKKNARFAIGLSAEHATSLVQQAETLAGPLATLRAKVKAIRSDSRLSDAGKSADVAASKAEAAQQIEQLAAKIGRHALIVDLNQRVATRTNGARERARQETQQDAAMLALELRQYVLPKLVKDGETMRVPASRTLEKMVLKFAESYSENPAKSEAVISALSVGWPWCPDLPEGTLAQVNDLIAGQVAGEEQQALVQAQQVQGLIDRATEAAMQEVREQR